MSDELHPALDVDDSGRVSLGVAGDQLPIAGTSRAALEGAPCGSPIAAVTDELEQPIPGHLELGTGGTMRNAIVAAVVAAVVASSSAGAASGFRWPHHGHRSHVVPSVVWAWDLPVPVGATVTDTVPCPAGSLATGGGADGPGDLRASGPSEHGSALTADGWTVTVRNDTDASVTVRAYAVCVA